MEEFPYKELVKLNGSSFQRFSHTLSIKLPDGLGLDGLRRVSSHFSEFLEERDKFPHEVRGNGLRASLNETLEIYRVITQGEDEERRYTVWVDDLGNGFRVVNIAPDINGGFTIRTGEYAERFLPEIPKCAY